MARESVSELLKSSATNGVGQSESGMRHGDTARSEGRHHDDDRSADHNRPAHHGGSDNGDHIASDHRCSGRSTSSCSPVASSGNCYQAGEFCPNADHGMSGTTASGEAIICEDNNGWRWEPS